MAKKEAGSPIPTNIVTGFLGAGKTTAIQSLITKKPQDERWAVLVNEFGEVGIDSNLFEGTTEDHNGVTISQVPGGCMCCANGLPIQMALSILIAKSKPHRLLIEPTGLGHPKEVLSMLSRDYYQENLELRSTVSIVDARKIQDSRYTANDTFNQQIEVAEVIIANKADLYEARDFPALIDYIDRNFSLDDKSIYQVQQGALEIDWLAEPAILSKFTTSLKDSKQGPPSSLPPNLKAPTEGYLSAENSGEGFFSKGWIFNSSMQFEVKKLFSMVQGVEAERLKGVFITPSGPIAFNKTDSVVTQVNLNALNDSRMEVISGRIDMIEGVEEALLECLAS
jgi:G3E family GTPase